MSFRPLANPQIVAATSCHSRLQVLDTDSFGLGTTILRSALAAARVERMMRRMSRIHKVFVSYHHQFDEARKKIFELRFGNGFDAIIPGAVQIGDIDETLPTETIRQKIRNEYLRDTSVTVVLVGALTWQRKHVDWEIGSSIRDTPANPRSGLLGIVLPAYYDHYFGGRRDKYDPHTIPPRLNDNVEAGFATLHNWTDDHVEIQNWVHDAYLRKSRIQPDNGRPSFAKNRSSDRWDQ